MFMDFDVCSLDVENASLWRIIAQCGEMTKERSEGVYFSFLANDDVVGATTGEWSLRHHRSFIHLYLPKWCAGK